MELLIPMSVILPKKIFYRRLLKIGDSLRKYFSLEIWFCGQVYPKTFYPF